MRKKCNCSATKKKNVKGSFKRNISKKRKPKKQEKKRL